MADQPAQRQVNCPICTGTVTPNQNGKVFSYITGFCQRHKIVIPTALLNYFKERLQIPKSDILEGKCEACNNTGTIKDPTDDSAKYEQVKSLVQQNIKEVTDLEALLSPPGGNFSATFQGDGSVQFGLGMNTVPSYRQDPDGLRLKQMVIKPKGTIPAGGKAVQTIGTNPTSSPGGTFTIACGNSFRVVTGSIGIEMNTGGPVTISGGIMSFTGAEVTIGSSSKTAIGGDVVSIDGKSIECSPTDGAFIVKGHIDSTGDIKSGGNIHGESGTFVDLTCVGANETSKIGSPNDLITGGPKWGGPVEDASLWAIKDLAFAAKKNMTDWRFAQQLVAPAGISALTDKMANLTYSLLPTELIPSGYVEIANIPGLELVETLLFPVYLYPHHHGLPNLRLTVDTHVIAANKKDKAEDVRSSAVASNNSGGAPSTRQHTTALDAALSIFGTSTAAIGTSLETLAKGLFRPSGSDVA
jgi:ribosomal protein S27E